MKHKILMKSYIYTFLILLTIAACTDGKYTLLSPDGLLKVEVSLPQKGNENSLSYNIYNQDKLISQGNQLGVELDSSTGLFYKNLRLLSFRQFYVEDLIKQQHGTIQRNRANGIRFMLANTEGRNLNVVFRIYDDGVAFHYELFNEENEVLLDEFSSFSVPVHGALTNTSVPARFSIDQRKNIIISTTKDSLLMHPQLVSREQHQVIDISASLPVLLPENYVTPWRFTMISDKDIDQSEIFSKKLRLKTEYAY